MRCGSCGTENAETSRFCQECGKPIVKVEAPRACARCGAELQSHLRFCIQCGMPVPQEAPAAPAQPAAAQLAPVQPAPAQPAPERRAYDVPAPTSPMAAVGAEIARHHVEPAPAQPAAPQVQPQPIQPAVAPQVQPQPFPAQPSVAPVQPQPVAPQPIEPVQAPAPQAPAPIPAVEPVRTATACLRMIDSQGRPGEPIVLTGERVDLGRLEGEIRLADDAFLDRRHVRFELREGRWYATDLETVNGTFIRIRERTRLVDGDRILMGRQLLLFETLKPDEACRNAVMIRGVMVFGAPAEPVSARLTRLTTEGLGRDVLYLYRGETMLGRERGDIVFSDDAFLSRLHARIVREGPEGPHFLEDMGSSNGTSIRIRGRVPLSHGDELRVGRHLFRFENDGSLGGVGSA